MRCTGTGRRVVAALLILTARAATQDPVVESALQLERERRFAEARRTLEAGLADQPTVERAEAWVQYLRRTGDAETAGRDARERLARFPGSATLTCLAADHLGWQEQQFDAAKHLYQTLARLPGQEEIATQRLAALDREESLHARAAALTRRSRWVTLLVTAVVAAVCLLAGRSRRE